MRKIAVGDTVWIQGPITLIHSVWKSGGNPYGVWEVKRILRFAGEEKEVVLKAMDGGGVEITVSVVNVIVCDRFGGA